MQTKRIRPDYHTVAGNPIWLRFPWRSQFTLEDIKLSMCGMRRYNGSLDCRLVTHSNLAAELGLGWSLDPQDLEAIIEAGYCAWHDAQEALIQDLIHGIKEQLPDFKDNIEPPWEERVLDFVGLSPAMYPVHQVVTYDKRALLVEMKFYGHQRYEAKREEFEMVEVQDWELALLEEIHNQEPEKQWERLMNHVTRAVRAQGKLYGTSGIGETFGSP